MYIATNNLREDDVIYVHYFCLIYAIPTNSIT